MLPYAVSSNPLHYHRIRQLPLWLIYSYLLVKQQRAQQPQSPLEEFKQMGVAMEEDL